jgi:membrane-associated phospholipid phosphatase
MTAVAMAVLVSSTSARADDPTPPVDRVTFEAEPLLDGALIGGTLGFALVIGSIDGTGEIRPQQISKTFDRSQLLGIDRGAVYQHVDSNASTYSSLGLYAAFAYAAFDTVFSAVQEHDVQTGIVDAVMYAESMSITLGVTTLTKLAIRRPRPQAYIDAEAHKDDPSYSNSDTDSSLSFFSNHASMVAAIGGTATYLAFARSPHGIRPWITLICAVGLSTMVSIERVRSGDHFPTDVIAGTIVGGGIGVLIPHLHRTATSKHTFWVGANPADRGEGGSLSLSGTF